MKKVAWIGTGVMGASMAGHLLKAGYPVSVYNRSPQKAQAMASLGATVCSTIWEAVAGADFVFTIVGYPADVEQVYLGKDGILEHIETGAVIVDMTTSSPALAVRIAEEAKKKGVSSVDAPVSGGDAGAKAGTLSIMAGGEEDAFLKVKPLFERMGKTIVYMGGPGYGQHTKAANQIAVAGATAAMTEAIVYAKKVGLDPQQMLNAISAGAAGSWQLNNMAPRVLRGDLAPGFYIKHFIKDMRIIRDEASSRNTSLSMLNAVLSLYEQMADKGMEDLGTQALLKLYE